MRMKNILYIAIVLASALMAGCGPERSSIDENGFAVVRILAPAAEDSSAAKAASDVFEENVKLLKNNTIMQAVASRMTDRARDALSAAASRENMSVEDILLENLVVRWSGRDGAMLIGFKFPDKKMSADLANVCAAEFVSNSQSAAVKSIMDSIDELREKVAQQEEKVRAIDEKLLALRVEQRRQRPRLKRRRRPGTALLWKVRKRFSTRPRKALPKSKKRLLGRTRPRRSTRPLSANAGRPRPCTRRLLTR